MLIPIIQVKGVILLSTPDLNDCVQISLIKAVQKKRNLLSHCGYFDIVAVLFLAT